MKINMGMDGDIVVMELVGNLVASTAEQVKAQIAKLTQKGFKHVILELGGVDFMDSSGLGACMAMHKSLLEKEGMLVCVRPSDAVAKVFRITKADQKLSIASARRDALKTLNAKILEDAKK